MSLIEVGGLVMYRITPAMFLGATAFAASCWLAPVATANVKILFRSPEQPAPRRASTSQGASRGLLCGQASPDSAPVSVKALLPESHYGITGAERPTIVAYLPETSATEVFFSLKDEAKQLHFETTMPISGEAGLISLQLPEHAPALEPGKHYQWFLAVKCNGELRPSSPFVDGWIQRVQPDESTASVMVQPPSLAKAASLSEAGFWYDTLATLAHLKQAQASDSETAQAWRDLLEWTEFNAQELEMLASSEVLQ